jgi:glycosyltransferase involved in cell wall biosynthesis
MPGDRVTVIYNGRPLDRYRDGSAEGLAQELGIPADAPVVGNVGRLIERKGQRDLVDAWPAVRSDHPEAHCVFVGDGRDRATMVERSVTLGCGDSVHFVGAREDVPAFLDLFDVFAFPSHHEGLPGAPIEAMAASLPIVATDIDGTNELVTDGETGLLVPPRDPQALGAAVDRVLSDPQLGRSLGTAARSAAYERFSLETMVEQFETLYERIA